MLSCFSSIQLFATPWTVVCQAPLSMRSFRQEHWSGLPYHPPGDLPDPGVKPELSVSSAQKILYCQATGKTPNISKLHKKCKKVFLFIKIQLYFCYHLFKICVFLSVFKSVNFKKKFNDNNIDYHLKVMYSPLDDQCYD